MKFSVDNFEDAPFENYDLDLRQKEVDGGQISIEQIDSIRNFPNAKSLVISGLQDDTLAYFVEHYASQFEVVSFWKNKRLTNLDALEKLQSVEFLIFFYNTKVQKLWNMEKNRKLKGLCIYNFSKLHNIDGIEKCKRLKYFAFGCEAGNSDKNIYLESFKKLKETNIDYFGWWGTVLDGDYKVLSETSIKKLDLSPHKFTLEELADFLACFPDSLKGKATLPYTVGSIIDNGSESLYIFPCKGTKTFVKGKDDERLKKYLEKFNQMLSDKRREMKCQL
ncbi:MAG: hypothetical protein K6E22_11435 [Treponema sp.]|nr:hypothetical protein [Treponema sp.]